MIRRLEEVAINAWPSLQTYIYDGWIIRFSNGYTKRANSINPLYSPVENIDEKIDYCETLFRQKDLPIVYKLTEESQAIELDKLLEERGYHRVDITSLQTLDLVNDEFILNHEICLAEFDHIEIDHTSSGSVDNNRESVRSAHLCRFGSELSDKWLTAFCALSNLSSKQRNILKKMLNRSTVNNFYFSITVDREIIACGLGVQENKYFGLFDIIVSEEYRGRGYGEELIKSMLSFARNNSARTAYLQVVKSNIPAINLYKKLGFTELYKYWYRVKD
ncbi:MAG: GNAT family N-acetyltransferase [Halanaerobiales bacterium]